MQFSDDEKEQEDEQFMMNGRKNTSRLGVE